MIAQKRWCEALMHSIASTSTLMWLSDHRGSSAGLEQGNLAVKRKDRSATATAEMALEQVRSLTWTEVQRNIILGLDDWVCLHQGCTHAEVGNLVGTDPRPLKRLSAFDAGPAQDWGQVPMPPIAAGEQVKRQPERGWVHPPEIRGKSPLIFLGGGSRGKCFGSLTIGRSRSDQPDLGR